MYGTVHTESPERESTEEAWAMNQLRGTPVTKSQRNSTFDAQEKLGSASISKKIAEFRVGETIFRQGDPSEHIFYIQKGGVKLSKQYWQGGGDSSSGAGSVFW